jgi:hypothetical protein
MNKIFTLYAYALLASCGNCGDVRDFPDTETRLLVEEFEATFDIRAQSVVVAIVDIVPDGNEDMVGLCETRNNAAPKIYLLKSWWEKADHIMKKQLIFHESGHCLGNLDHDNSEVDWRKKSIMHEHMVGQPVFEQYYDEYINDMKKRLE